MALVGRWMFRTALVCSAGAALLLALAFTPTLFGYESFIVTSGSMGSYAPTGSVVLTRMVSVRSLGPGDVISFRAAGRGSRVTHRIVELRAEKSRFIVTTKGDANRIADPEPLILRNDASVARAEKVVPHAGTIVRLARTPLGAVIVFLVPIAGLAVDRERDVRRRVPVRRRHAVAARRTQVAEVRKKKRVRSPVTGVRPRTALTLVEHPLVHLPRAAGDHERLEANPPLYRIVAEYPPRWRASAADTGA